MLNPRKPLLFRRRDELAIHNHGRTGIPVIGIDSDD
jgi:hypothetical protein